MTSAITRAQQAVPLIYEPLNRYETDLVNTIEAGVSLVRSLKTKNVRLLADLFHMNIEEADIAAALRAGGKLIGHVHFVDSNRRPAGCGHLDYGPIAGALTEIGYDGFASAEALPYPDPDAAASTDDRVVPPLFPHRSQPTDDHALDPGTPPELRLRRPARPGDARARRGDAPVGRAGSSRSSPSSRSAR